MATDVAKSSTGSRPDNEHVGEKQVVRAGVGPCLPFSEQDTIVSRSSRRISWHIWPFWVGLSSVRVIPIWVVLVEVGGVTGTMSCNLVIYKE